jgi:PAS domain S-box-containing protein
VSGPQHLDDSVIRRILEDEPIGVAICERAGDDFRYAYVNRAFQALRPHVPMGGQPHRKIWPDLTTPFPTLMQRVLDTGEPWTGENIPVGTGAGSDPRHVNYYTFNLSRLQSQAGLGVLILARETSLEVKTSEHLRETDRRLHLALQAGRSGMFEWDLVRDRVYWSPELEEIHGLERGEFDGSAASARQAIYESDRVAVLKSMDDGLRVGEWETEHRIVHERSREVRWVYSRARVLYDQSRNPIRVIGFTTDITRLKDAEVKAHEELETTALLLEAADALSSWTDLDALLQGLAAIILKAIPHRRVRLALRSEEGETIRFVVSAGGLNLSPGKEFGLSELTDDMQRAYATGKPCIIDYDALPEGSRGIADSLQTHISLVVPLVSGDDVMGHFAVDDVDARRPFSEREIHVATGIAAQAAVAISNARLLESERRIAHFSTLLAETSSALSSTSDLDRVLPEVVQRIGEEIGAVDVTLTLKQPGGWRMAHHWGTGSLDRDFYTDEELLEHVRVVESGAPLLVDDVNKAGVNRGLIEELGYQSFVIYPLVFHDEVIGTLDFAFGEPGRASSGRSLDFMSRVAYVVSASMSNARLLRETTRQAEFAEALNRINRAVHSTVDLDEIMQRIVIDTTTALGVDATAVRMFRQGGWEFTYSHGLPEGLRNLKSSEDEAPISTAALGDKHIVAVNRVSGDPRVNAPVLEEHDVRSLMAVPLAIHGEGLGVLLMCCIGRECEFGAAEKDFAQKVAATLSLAVGNARLYQTEHGIAETLQQALLAIPDSLPGIDFAHSYHSATEATRVGGDFYDLVELDERRVGVVIGDVAGKGLDAAVLTSLVKNTIRAHAVESDKSPGAVLALTNEVVYRATPAESFVTVFFGVLDRPSGRLVFANAGHATGMIARPGRETAFLRATGPLLGAFQDIEFDPAEVYFLAPDELLFLYTDGVTEARADGNQFGEKRLADLLGEKASREPIEVVDSVLSDVLDYSRGRLRDDVAILALRRLDQDAIGPSQQRFEV